MPAQDLSLRIWLDSALDSTWRCSYRDGDSTVVVSFPDLDALGDFIAEELGLSVIGALNRTTDKRLDREDRDGERTKYTLA